MKRVTLYDIAEAQRLTLKFNSSKESPLLLSDHILEVITRKMHVCIQDSKRRFRHILLAHPHLKRPIRDNERIRYNLAHLSDDISMLQISL